jgi:hypothetical protein
MEKIEAAQAGSAAGGVKRHAGSCHCGAVRFEVEIEAGAMASRCNCTICTKVAQTSTIVKPGAFSLASGAEALSEYRWGGETGTRFFCKHCGIHCFGRGHLAELGGDYVSVILNALDDVDVSQCKVVYWDGRHNNWEAGPRDAPWPIFAPTSA